MTKLRLSPPSLRSACAAAQVIYDIIFVSVSLTIIIEVDFHGDIMFDLIYKKLYILGLFTARYVTGFFSVSYTHLTLPTKA